ncbi:MAG: TrmH family RNA methyltransferase [Patescibacteria group bacterium]
MIVILYNIRSLYNVGSVFRTADAVGVEKIYLCGITSSPLDRFGKLRPQLAKVSLGAEKSVKWEKVKATSALINKLKEEGYKIFAVEQAENSIPYYKTNLLTSDVNKLVLVMGNEVRGLPPAILKKADKVLEIPMKGRKESLNVSVAFAVIAYFLRFGRK